MSDWLTDIAGSPGADAFSTTTAPFTQPASGGSVAVSVLSTGFLGVGISVFVAGGGYYSVVAVNNATNCMLQNSGASSNASPGVTVASGSRIAPGGAPGAAGTPGTPGANGAGRPAVRAVQTAALPAYTYDPTAKTITFTANGPISSSFFDGIVPLSTDTYKDFLLLLEGTKNGIYTATQTGVTSVSPCILTRRADLDSSGDFANGVQVDVLDGATSGGNNKGTRWAMTSLGAITLDTTATTWAQSRPATPLEIDLTLPPYSVTYAPSRGTVSGDWTATYNQAVYDASLLGAGVVLKEGRGWVQKSATLMRSNVVIRGCGKDATHSVSPYYAGPDFWFGVVTPFTVGGTLVDTTSGSTPLQMWHSTDLLQSPLVWARGDGGLVMTNWAQYDARFLIRVAALGSISGHLASTRGQLLGNDPIDIHDSLLLTPTGALQAQLRLWSPDHVIQTGPTSPAVTLSGSALPTAVFLRIEMLSGGAVGTAKFRLSGTDGKTWYPVAGSESIVTASSFTIANGQMAGTVINFAAGTYAAGTVYRNQEQLNVNTAAGKVAITTNVQIAVTFDAGVTNTLSVYVSNADGAHAYDAAPTTTAATLVNGRPNQQIYEDTVIGDGANQKVLLALTDINPAQFYLGSVMYSQHVRTTTGTCPSSLNIATVPVVSGAFTGQDQAGVGLAFNPNTSSALTGPDGVVYGWRATSKGGKLAEIMARRRSSAFLTHTGLQDHESYTAAGNNRNHVSIDCGLNYSIFDRLSLVGGEEGFMQRSPCFFNRFQDIYAACSRYDFGFTTGEAALSGQNVGEGTGINWIAIGAGFSQSGSCWSNPEGNTPYAGIILNFVTGVFANFTADDESGPGCLLATASIAVTAGQSLKMHVFMTDGATQPFRVRGGAGFNGTLTITGTVGAAMPGCAYMFDVNAGCPPIQLPTGFINPQGVPLASNPGCVVLGNGRAAKGADLTNTSVTITYDQGPRRELPAGTLTGAQTLTFGTANVFESQTMTVAWGAQGFNYSFVDGGAGTPAMYTAAAGTKGRISGRWNGTNWTEIDISLYT